ncbi:cytidine deaminase [Vulgatibacter sp.]|uniref:cytidine deaminase n=1 Tax=Vulgatibacter sp. TaxID=1971226 RepID=UPI003569CF4B
MATRKKTAAAPRRKATAAPRRDTATKPRPGKPSPARMERLLTSALAVRQRAYAPYSKFQVGAAVLGDDGRIYAGCNVENSSYGLCLCAERNAMGQAIARGATKVLAAAVVAPSARPTPPCGMCLQSFAELAEGDIPILLANPQGDREELHLGDLLPHRFDRSYLPGKR